MCDAQAGTRRCPRYRRLGSQGLRHNKATFVTATCCQSGCEKPLCDLHMFPRDRGSDDTRLKFCGECITTRARCIACGFAGIEAQYNINREHNGKFPHRPRKETLWPCGEGCYNLLCSRCGTTQDGCALHCRQFPTAVWYAHWGVRRFKGELGYQAAYRQLTPEEQAYMCSVLQPLAHPQAINGVTQQAAGLQPLAMPQALEMAYSPQVVPAPVLLPMGTRCIPERPLPRSLTPSLIF